MPAPCPTHEKARMGKGNVQISLLGTSFLIQADEESEYLSRIVEYLSQKVQEIEQSVAIKDPLRIAILTGLLLADELFKERGRGRKATSEEEAEEAERIALSLIEKIDKSLLDE